jgi:hypothetical protein
MSAHAPLSRLRWPWRGSALREPSAAEVYEGQLQQPVSTDRTGAVGVNFLDAAESRVQWQRTSYRTAQRSVAAVTAEIPAAEDSRWVPWCPQCPNLPAIDPTTLGTAEYLSRQHDIVLHDGAWTARAWPATDLDRRASAHTTGGAR